MEFVQAAEFFIRPERRICYFAFIYDFVYNRLLMVKFFESEGKFQSPAVCRPRLCLLSFVDFGICSV